MSYRNTLIVSLATLLLAAVAYAGVRQSDTAGECLTREAVLESHSNSWQGISMTCNEQIRQHNLQQLGELSTGD